MDQAVSPYRNGQTFGRPSSYKEEYCQDIIEFFNRPTTRIITKTYTTKAGTIIEEPIEKGCEFPTIEEYCSKIGVETSTLYDWLKVYPDFHSAFLRAKALQKDCLIKNAITGRYDPRFSVFVATNCTDMRVQPLEVHSTVEHTLGDAEMQLLSRQKRMLLGDSQDVIEVPSTE